MISNGPEDTQVFYAVPHGFEDIPEWDEWAESLWALQELVSSDPSDFDDDAPVYEIKVRKVGTIVKTANLDTYI